MPPQLLAVVRGHEDLGENPESPKRAAASPKQGDKRPAEEPLEAIDPEVPGSGGSVLSATVEVHAEHLDEEAIGLPEEAWETLNEERSNLVPKCRQHGQWKCNISPRWPQDRANMIIKAELGTMMDHKGWAWRRRRTNIVSRCSSKTSILLQGSILQNLMPG